MSYVIRIAKDFIAANKTDCLASVYCFMVMFNVSAAHRDFNRWHKIIIRAFFSSGCQVPSAMTLMEGKKKKEENLLRHRDQKKKKITVNENKIRR